MMFLGTRISQIPPGKLKSAKGGLGEHLSEKVTIKSSNTHG